MQKLEDFFLGQVPSSARRRMFVVHGLGGIGKTQICVEFARKHHERYTAVFWMDGSSEDALRQSFINVAPLLPSKEISKVLFGTVEQGNVSTEVIVRGVLEWLALPSNYGWLYIIDNVDHDFNAKVKDPSSYDITKYLAQVDHGSILITSRLSTLTVPQNSLQLTEMNAKESRTLFELQSGRSAPGMLSISGNRYCSNHTSELESSGSSDLDKLLRRLEGMPLALAQAGACIRLTNISIKEYLGYYDHTWDDLVTDQDNYPLSEYVQRSMLTTWRISYQQVERHSIEAAKLLKFWAYLDPKDMWYELITCSVELQSKMNIPEWLSTLAKSRLKFRSALGLLKKYSLVNNGTDTTNYSMHAVLHSWCRHLASMGSMSELYPELAVSVVARMVPDENDGQGWNLRRRLLPHGQQLLSYSRLGTMWRLSHVPAGIYEKPAKLFEYSKAYEEAAELLEDAVKEKEKDLGQDQASKLDAFRKLARMYCKMGRSWNSKSEWLCEHALAGCEKALKLDPTISLDVAQRMFNILLACGQPDIKPLKTASDLLWVLNTVYLTKDGLAGAEEVLQLTLAEHMGSQLGWDNHVISLSKQSSEIYDDFDRLVEAHNETFATEYDLTPENRLRHGKDIDAEMTTERAPAETEESFGMDRIRALRDDCGLAMCYAGQANKLQDARTLYERLIPRLTTILGLDNDATQGVIQALGALYYEKLYMLSEAEDCFLQNFKTSEKLRGPRHKETITALSNLACVYRSQGDKVREAAVRREIDLANAGPVWYKHSYGVVTPRRHHHHGSFSLSSRDITLDSNWNLIASCRRFDGTWNQSTLSLNEILENAYGKFSWGGHGNFAATARNVRLEADGRLLAARLKKGRGTWVPCTVRLDERIANSNGKLVFLSQRMLTSGL